MASVSALIENLLESPPSGVPETGEQLVRFVSDGRLSPEQFVEDPLALVGPPYFVSRYLAQVILRALKNEYEGLDEVMTSLTALLERNAPILERKRGSTSERIVIPEARVVNLRHPAQGERGVWESSIDALVTSGPLRNREIRIHCRSDENQMACFLVPYLWIHSAISAYNLLPADEGSFNASIASSRKPIKCAGVKAM